MADSNSIRLVGIDPPGLAAASPAEVLAFRRRTGEVALELIRDQLRQGIGRDGAKLKPVKPESRPDGADGKPLDPHYAASRSWRWLRYSTSKDGVTVWWSHGWGRILGYHRAGAGHLPVRDVIGLTAAHEKKLKEFMGRWWKLRHRAKVAKPKPKPAPTLTAPKPPKGAPAPSAYPTPQAAKLAKKYPQLAQFLMTPK